MQRILLLGGDTRQQELQKLLAASGYCVSSVALTSDAFFSLEKEMAQSDVLLCPVPFSKDTQFLYSLENPKSIVIEEFLSYLNKSHTVFGGNIPAAVTAHCEKLTIPCYDLMKAEEIGIRNAVATAEGAIAEAIKHSHVNLNSSKVLVLGYGRCGRLIADALRGLHASVTVCDINAETLVWANSFGYRVLKIQELQGTIHSYTYIFNTVPSRVLDNTLLKQLHPDVTLIDIASAPGGMDHSVCQELGINAHLCLGLPGKYAPRASAEILFNGIMHLL